MPKFTQIDYDREMAFIATRVVDGNPETLGVVRTSTKPDNSEAEFAAIIVQSSMKGTGLGSALWESSSLLQRSGCLHVGQTMPATRP